MLFILLALGISFCVFVGMAIGLHDADDQQRGLGAENTRLRQHCAGFADELRSYRAYEQYEHQRTAQLRRLGPGR